MKCPECRGSGEGETDPSGAYSQTCPVCDGRGSIVLRGPDGRFVPDDFYQRIEAEVEAAVTHGRLSE